MHFFMDIEATDSSQSKRGWNIVFLSLSPHPFRVSKKCRVSEREWRTKCFMFPVIAIMQMLDRLLSMGAERNSLNKHGGRISFAWWHSSFNQNTSRKGVKIEKKHKTVSCSIALRHSPSLNVFFSRLWTALCLQGRFRWNTERHHGDSARRHQECDQEI